MVKLIMIMLTALMVSACQSQNSKEKLAPSENVEIITKKRISDLASLPNLDGDSISIAVYKFSDMTGQRKPSQSFANLSSAVTQGSEVFLIKALQDAGNGKWFKVVERVGLDNLVKERQIIRSQRELYEKEEAKPLTPLIVAGVMIEGGVVGYDSNVATGGLGARILGIGASQEYRKDEVTVVLRLISVNTGEVLLSTGASKTILSTSAGVNMFKFIDLGTKSVEFEAGATANEPATYAVRIATEAAVADMIKEGAKKKLWKFKTRGK
jgi:curli production assembly/transport component CsgG